MRASERERVGKRGKEKGNLILIERLIKSIFKLDICKAFFFNFFG